MLNNAPVGIAANALNINASVIVCAKAASVLASRRKMTAHPGSNILGEVRHQYA
jgi:hypothetical protein